MADDPLKKAEDLIENIERLDGKEVDNLNSGMMFPNDVKLGKTPEEAIEIARADSMKKGVPFQEPGDVQEKQVGDSARRYIDDAVRKMLDDAFKGGA